MLDFDRDGGDKGRNSLGKASEMARPRKGRKGPVGSEARRGRSRMRLVQNLGCQLENWRFYPGGNGEPWEVFEQGGRNSPACWRTLSGSYGVGNT